ncbi:MAG: cob(I)yrinic acid a,c-diamide adenosyltransferase [Oscillospiraceae bacterium]|nr:cob(I)yrinic acid a,c-diamide adenosyltransferase [Oscillospiraceae bacterium]
MSLDELFKRADYVTKFVKEKHPFDQGLGCRKGIEE